MKKNITTATAMVFITLLLLMLSSKGYCGITSDELQPEMGMFSLETGFEPYYMSIRDGLLSEHHYRTCQILAIPSFEREWVIYIVREDGKQSMVVYKVMKKHLWSEMMAAIHEEVPHGPWSLSAPDQIKALSKLKKDVESYSVPIHEQTADLLGRVWNAALLRVRYPKENMFWLDGTTYHVAHFIKGKGAWSGTTWSPAPETTPGILVQLAEALKDYAIAPSPKQKTIENNIIAKAKHLQATLEKKEKNIKKRK